MNWPLIAVAAVNLTLSTVGGICAKLWGVTNSNTWLLIGIGVNFFTLLSFMTVVRLGGLSIASTIVLIFTIILNVLVGVGIFHESVKPSQWFGIAIGILAILFIAGLVKLPLDRG